jgi:hypothetical protein
MALIHALKLALWQAHPAADSWRGEVLNFMVQARDRFEPAMARRIDAAALLGRAQHAVRQLDTTGHERSRLRDAGEASLDVLLGESTSVADLVKLVGGDDA